MDDKPDEKNEPAVPTSASEGTAEEPTRVLPPDQPAAGAGPPAAPRQRFTERLWSFRSVIAVALASVLIGGAGGAALASVSNDDGPDAGSGPGHGRFGPGDGRFGGPGMQHRRQGGQGRQNGGGQFGGPGGFGQQNGPQDGQPTPPTTQPSPGGSVS